MKLLRLSDQPGFYTHRLESDNRHTKMRS